ncbi:hypothetical protein [Desulfosudis oleivorans]|uniref:hypothetical protein n=1 Tax=Desulfosudis oleivorans TaxID=181663 RepID=UPI00129474AA|nr:hypothetical protein [Desulfosudis oleivorans]
MNIEEWKQMLAYTKDWKAWLESIDVIPEEEIRREKFVAQMNVAIKKWEEKLAKISDE